jgi:CRP/FNR family transcriptional regulator, cyclic AMP receptor protein
LAAGRGRPSDGQRGRSRCGGIPLNQERHPTPRDPQAATKRLLRQAPLFAHLAEEELTALAKVSRRRTYKRNEVIIRADEPADAFFLLTSGSVKVSLRDRQWNEVILKILYPFSFFGEMAFLDEQRRSATVSAIEKSDTLSFAREDFTRFIQHSPEVILKMLVTMSQRLRQADQKIARLALTSASGRVAMALLELLADHGGRAVGGGIAIDLRLTRKELADLAGVARETLVRALAEFQRRGWVRLDRRAIVVLKQAMLRQEAAL